MGPVFICAQVYRRPYLLLHEQDLTPFSLNMYRVINNGVVINGAAKLCYDGH